ncbi:probable pectinesterase/pectinesterase inhibitor 13 [Lycium barbarum]|uniref:probable pectinesterase/pectinesterase inhibitor 13 n=1 Tax=Lycium barbarum TaxID=112863 RepID=UPI00293F3438|nr:probable pectinesterase/pectinesterase inhibitor 13 [Lycium barbarum]
MAFQDFDQISERRKLERQQKMKKRIMIAVVLLLLILVAVAAAVVYFVVLKNKGDDASANKSNKNASTPPPKEPTTPESAATPPPKVDASPPPSPPSEADAAPPPAEGAAAPPPKEDDVVAPPPKEDGAAASPPDGSTPPAPSPDGAETPAPSPQEGDNATTAPAPSPKGEGTIGAICAGTDFSQSCGDILSKVLQANASGAQPKDLLKATVSAAIEEIATGIDELGKINKDIPEKTVAYDDCMALLADAKKDLNTSVYMLDGGINDVASTTAELNNKLSAALTYQGMCVDGYPESDQSTVQAALKKTEEHTINSLAVASGLSSSPQPNSNAKRRLLTTRLGVPAWINQGDRRMLDGEDEGKDIKALANITVAKDGSGNFPTINEAIKAVPQSYEGRYFIYIKEGVYEENVVVSQSQVNLTFVGDGSQKSIITGSKNIVDDLSTYQSATVVISGEGFFGYKVGFRNTAGPEKLQAVALRVQADHAVFLNCRMEGYQSVIYASTYRQFYRGCYITGTVDIISGNAAAVFQTCQIYLRKPMDDQKNVITAQGRSSKHQTTGTVLQSCGIFADDQLTPEKSRFKSYLGRPMKEYSRTIVMETDITDVIDPEGWEATSGDYALSTLYFGEYNNKGAGAETSSRIKWAGYQGSIGKDAALNYTVESFLQGQTWLKDYDVQVRFGLSN